MAGKRKVNEKSAVETVKRKKKEVLKEISESEDQDDQDFVEGNINGAKAKKNSTKAAAKSKVQTRSRKSTVEGSDAKPKKSKRKNAKISDSESDAKEELKSEIVSKVTPNKQVNGSFKDDIDNSSKNLPECSSVPTSSGITAGACSSSDEEWEEVAENNEQELLDNYKPDIPKGGVEITLDLPDVNLKKRQRKACDVNEFIRLHINRIRKDNQLAVHKVHMLCLLSRGFYINGVLNSPDLKGIVLSLIPEQLLWGKQKMNKVNTDEIKQIYDWFCSAYGLEQSNEACPNISVSLLSSFNSGKAPNSSLLNMMLVAFARTLGLRARLCMSLYPITHKAKNLIPKPNGKAPKPRKETKGKAVKREKSCPRPAKKSSKLKSKKEVKEETNDDDETVNKKGGKIQRPRRSVNKKYNFSSDDSDFDNQDEDFVVKKESESERDSSPGPDYEPTVFTELSPKPNRLLKKSPKAKNRQILSSDDDNDSSDADIEMMQHRVLCWAEIFSKAEEQWIAIECTNKIFNEPAEVASVLPQPVVYIVSYDNNSYVKDLTRRYCSEFMTVTRKLRVVSDWWDESLEPFLPPNTKQNKEEDKNLEKKLSDMPMPTTISQFKNHPLYALKRHLLKFEALYPPDAPSVGFIRKEPIYARECVVQLHSRETWLKEARTVRVGEEPYKIVKARPKWDRMSGTVKTDLPLEIFGFWQTEKYQPPTARDGKVPRNEYGNVELFKMCMLPKGTVHLQLPGLNRVAKKLGIDCSPAVVGFDGHKGSIHPVFDGFVVCKEFKNTLIEAWDEDQENARKREEEKREKRIIGNWRRLIKGLLIRERIKNKYSTK